MPGSGRCAQRTVRRAALRWWRRRGSTNCGPGGRPLACLRSRAAVQLLVTPPSPASGAGLLQVVARGTSAQRRPPRTPPASGGQPLLPAEQALAPLGGAGRSLPAAAAGRSVGCRRPAPWPPSPRRCAPASGRAGALRSTPLPSLIGQGLVSAASQALPPAPTPLPRVPGHPWPRGQRSGATAAGSGGNAAAAAAGPLRVPAGRSSTSCHPPACLLRHPPACSSRLSPSSTRSSSTPTMRVRAGRRRLSGDVGGAAAHGRVALPCTAPSSLRVCAGACREHVAAAGERDTRDQQPQCLGAEL